MAEVASELIHEVPKSMRGRFDPMTLKLDGVRREISAISTHLAGLQQNMNTVYGVLARQDARLERIEPRLDLADAH
ncbi:hypothetical protein [Xanthobacter sp. ZOL 2024]